MTNQWFVPQGSFVPGITAVDWSQITSKPTTLLGYGITDPIVLTSGSYADPSWITSLAWGKLTGVPSSFTPSAHTQAWSTITSTPTTLSGYGITDAVPAARTITINGVTFDLSVNRSWNIAVRELLSSDRTYFVRTDGSDSNNGLTDSAGGAFLTWQKGIDVASSSLDSSIYDVIIQAGGSGARTFTVTTPIQLKPIPGSGRLILRGNTANNANVLITSSTVNCNLIEGNLSGNYTIDSIRFTQPASNTAGTFCLYAKAPGISLIQKNCNFGAMAGSSSRHLQVETASVIRIDGGYTISGVATFHIGVGPFAYLDYFSTSPITVTLTGTPAFTAFASVRNNSIARFFGITWSGSATGPRYSIANNSTIETFGSGTTYLPGNAAGTTDASSVYS